MSFDPDKHLLKLPQGKTKDGQMRYADYLEVKWRLVWFREECPTGVIDTEMIRLDLDRETQEVGRQWDQATKSYKEVTKRANGFVMFRAFVTDGKGGSATATKSEKAASFPDFIEKCESGAVGRALAMLGYGTQFTGDELAERHRIVDSPVQNG